MTPKVAIAGVCERDIDLLLLEEFLSSHEFRHWFIAQILGTEYDIRGFVNAQRSVTESSGESDLEVGVVDGAGSVIRLLIENKVNANLQPQQAERYRERGELYTVRHECAIYRTVIVAPKRYFGLDNSTKGFDSRVTYEAVLEWFQEATVLEERRKYKIALLKSAIDKGNVGYQILEDAPVTDFFRQYWELARELAPELAMKEPSSKPSRSDWVYFRPVVLPGNVEICHKMYKGWMDLQFAGKGDHVNEMYHALRAYLEPGMRVTRAGKSGVVRLMVPRLNRSMPFMDQKTDVCSAVGAAQSLFQWFLQHHQYMLGEMS
ncbi:MAG: hypothetical protein Q7K03_01630 [Dehalococcoidia bacterium]|nr:hypothetical protein [Dehalococcoidia bacterium]